MSDATATASTPNRDESHRGRFQRRLLTVLLLVGLFLYSGLIGMRIGAYASGSDSSGYLNVARLLSQGKIVVNQRLVPGVPATDRSYLYVPLGFRSIDTKHMVATYPIGLPFLITIASFLCSWSYAAKWVMWAHALAGAILMYALGRQCRLPPGWSALAALILAMSPLYVDFSLVLMSDVPAAVWVMAAMTCALRGREHTGWALAAGALTGYAVLIRPSNLLVALPAMLAIGGSPRRLVAYLVGGMPLAIVHVAYNTAAHVSLVSGGYGDVSELFRWSNVGPTLAHYGKWLPILLTPLAVLALGLPLLWRRHGRLVLVLAAWILVYVTFYVSYAFTHETWWYLRFLLPAFPAIAAAALLVARAGLEYLNVVRFLPAGSLRAWSAGFAATALLFGFDFHWNAELSTFGSGDGERNYPDAVAWLQREAHPRAVIFAMQMSGSLYYYSGYIVVRWDSIDAQNFAQITATAAAASRPVYALLKPYDIEQIRERHELFGTWTKLGAAHDTELWRYEGGTSDPFVLRETR